MATRNDATSESVFDSGDELSRMARRFASSTNETTVWDVYFQMLVGWQFHPGYLRDNAKALTLEECAALADKMMEVRTCHIWR